MEQMSHKYVTVAYELYSDNEKGIHELVEKAPVEHPFQFISGMGMTLELFEENILAHQAGEDFDFTLAVDDAYGPYVKEHVLELSKEMFMIDGRFDTSVIYAGNIIPLVNADGNRFQGLILEVKEDVVVVDLNHPLAGHALHFKGQVVVSRDATAEEIQSAINMMSGEGGCSGCGCDSCGNGSCGGHDHEHAGGCCGGHCH